MDELRSDPKFHAGQLVEITEGDFVGRVAQIGQSAAVDGKFQYGLTGLPETEGNLYAVHEYEIREAEEPVIEEIIDPAPAAATNHLPLSTGGEDDVSSLLQKASQVAQGRELEFNQALQSIVERLERIDQRLETKEIKVVVEVQHVYPEKRDTENKSKVTGSYLTCLRSGEVKWHEDRPPTYSDEDRLYEYDPAEEIVDKARSRISDLNGTKDNFIPFADLPEVEDDEDSPQLNIDLFSEGDE